VKKLEDDVHDEKGIFVRMRRTLNDVTREAFILSEDLTQSEVKREVEAYLKNFCDAFGHGDLKIEQEVCYVWKPSKPLKDKAIIVLVDTWEATSGTCFNYACRNWRETRAIINHALSESKRREEYEKITVKTYRDVPVLRVANATEKDNQANINRVAALKREL